MRHYLLILSALFFPLLAQTQPSLDIETDDKDGVRWLYFLVNDARSVYGYDLEISFNRQDVHVVDMNDAFAGVQITRGDFLGEKAYEITNTVNEAQGAIRLAASRLNPAPAVSGKGVIAIIGFQHNANKPSNITINRVQLGNTEGKLYQVDYPQKVAVEPASSVASEGKPDPDAYIASAREEGVMAESSILMYSIIALLLTMVILLLVLVARRKPQPA